MTGSYKPAKLPATMKSFDTKNYWETRLSKHNGLVGVGYARLGQSYNTWMYRIRRHVFRKQIQALKLNSANIQVLDVGSGTGFYIDQWQESGAKNITGLDLTQTAVNSLRRKYPQYTFHEQNIAADNAPAAIGQTFDAISMFDVVFHIVDDGEFQTTVHNLYQLLKPGGTLLFSDSFLHQAQQSNAQAHISHRLLSDVEDTLQQASFEIIRRVPMFVLMNQPIDGNWPAKWIWRALSFFISLHDVFGLIIGALLYPIELRLVLLLHESPATEIMICRKPVTPDSLIIQHTNESDHG